MTVERGEIALGDSVVVEYERRPGSAPPVVMVPSLGRGLEDFADLAGRLATAGHATLSINPRGVGASRGPLDGLTLFDFADDVVSFLDALEIPTVHLVGHAWGNRVARCITARRPEVVRSLTLLAAGGLVQPEPESDIHLGMMTIFDRTVSTEERLDALDRFFFAPRNDPDVWSDGWWLDAAALEAIAVTLTNTVEWWEPPSEIPLLVVQGLDDMAAPPENGRRLVADRRGARLVEVPDAGHALLPEQPDIVADAVARHVNDH